jgi:nucleotide-binding universal stress UspA family protein
MARNPAPRIVVGVSATPRDTAVGEWLARFAGGLQAQVTVVHVVPRTTLWLVSSVQADSDAYLAKIREHFEAGIVRQLRAHDLSVALRIVRGDPAHELAQIASRVEADLIVIGGPDHTALHDAISSIARRLEHSSDVPVVVVPTAKKVGSPGSRRASSRG